MIQPNEPQATDNNDLRIGVYICRCGGNISDVVDVEYLAEVSRNIPGVSVAKVQTFMCSDPGQKLIEEDVKAEKLDRVVVASCTPALHELTFRGAVVRSGLNPYLYEHVNIREQCSWAHKHDPEGATSKAMRLIAGAVGKLRYAAPLEQIKLPNHHKALVVGGGIAGMKVVADLAARGIGVVLVEKSDKLGGRLNEHGKVFPSEKQAGDLVARMVKQINDNPLVEVLLNTQVKEISGFVGNFSVTIEGAIGPDASPTSLQTTVGVLVMATGYRPYVPGQGEYGFNVSPAVITMNQFIDLMKQRKDAKQLAIDGRPVRRAAFLHCVGSRQVDGVNQPQEDGKINPYCSRVCCTTTLQQAADLRERFPGTVVYDLHQDIRTYGRGHEDYYYRASKSGVTFMRWTGDQPPQVQVNASGKWPLQITVKDALTWSEELELSVDLLVLATGMTPNPIGDLVDMLKLPTGDDRFLQEIHPKLRPVEISVNGVLLAGTAQSPMNIEECLQAAGTAAVKASAMFATDSVELNPYVAKVDEDVCGGCGKCVAECEYDGAIAMVDVDVDGQTVQRSRVNPGLCTGCGVCVAVCPKRAIDVQGWTMAQFEGMVDGIVADIPEAVGA